jgi:hypothetical protein
MERHGLSPTTTRTAEHVLKALSKKADLHNPLDVALAISRYKRGNEQPATNGYKKKIAESYDHFCKHHQITWTKPSYHTDEHSIQPPTAERISLLYSSAKMPLSLKVQVSAETGLRPIEVEGYKGLKVKDIHPDTKTITPTNTKRCNARPAIKISDELLCRLQEYIALSKLKPEDTIFQGTAEK